MIRHWFCGVALCCCPAIVAAAELPLWEAGPGLAVIDLPDYRGANQRHTYALPFPYVEYRGKFLKADRERVRGVLYTDPGMELNLSFNATPPVDSSTNQARSGMPDLDPTLEVGPSLDLHLWRSVSSNRSMDLRLPLRAVIATDFRHAHAEGWVFQPHINFDFKELGPEHKLRFGISAGPLFATRRFHEYFYGVDPQFAQLSRPSYVASGGYSGSQLTLALSRRDREVWLGAFVRYDHLDGSSMADSPLVKSREVMTVGIGVSWILSRSREQATGD
jgi:outer membrane scaffolding protein for murein synthesis (MipA/OmpV family)